jgi:hypothetical protein
MPYIIITIYDKNQDCNLLPTIYRIPKTKNYQYNFRNQVRIKIMKDKIKKELMKDYKDDVIIEELYNIDDYFIDNINDFKKISNDNI